MKHLLQIQTQLITNAPPYIDPNLITIKLIGVCATHSKVRYAALIFNQLPNANVIAWNTLLKAYAQNSEWFQTLHCFCKELHSPAFRQPDEYTFTSVLKACSGLVAVFDGQKVHAVAAKMGHQSNLCVSNSLVDMYFRFGLPVTAKLLFDEMLVRDVVTWNTMVNGYSLCGDVVSARCVFDQMDDNNMISWSAMITGYARSGDLDSARCLFNEMPERNVVVWNAIIAGYTQNEKYSDVIHLFRKMQQVGSVKPNDITLVCVLSACAQLGALDLGKWIDLFIKRNSVELKLFLGNALADMFIKCGCLAEGMRVFETMKERDVISWSIIVTGLAMHGYAEEAFSYFFEMLKTGVNPNEVTFMGLLSACTHAGLVERGLEYFKLMESEYGITPQIEHYGCMVDLLSRAGRLNEAEDLINSMPIKPNAIVWGALLGGCRIYKDFERGEMVVQRILELDSEHSGSYVYLANIYASMGRLDDSANSMLKMRKNGVLKVPGCSWIEVDNRVHEFFMGDRWHPQTDKIYSKIRELGPRMKIAGYKPNTDLVLQSVDEEEKENALSTHSEKLAIAFGLINTSEGTTIRIVKNLRVCSDCHEAAKIISKVVKREIIARDRSRFHIFREGSCSCNDCW
ncbi:hypothetical protein C5167_030875 [Papaver somniferum]|uniref:pentatricopeptide repeat-containing protein At3g62890-like n=1 Tax=Papaver somniferum TaxID=3469 RepID=UPI000E6F80BA|nr:pentatricopeptide repeat-containing protein At3g62890-like [Papaver somniferum]RZC89177.1 hypothetical protein C5167_030875 [Papaver somniferum]